MTNETCSLGKTKFVKHDISSENIDTFRFLLENIKCVDILPVNSPDNAYETCMILPFQKEKLKSKLNIYSLAG